MALQMAEQSRRRTPRNRRASIPVADVPPPVRPGLKGGLYKPLAQRDMERIHETALNLLQDLGLSQIPPSLEQRAVEAGCRVDEAGRLRFPRGLVEDILASTRRSLVLHGLDPVNDLEIGGQRVHTGTGGAAPTMIDFDTGRYRETTMADLYDIARLVDHLEYIHWFHRSVIARDTETVLDLDINTIYACMRGTAKPIMTSFTTGEIVSAAMPMLDLVAGGDGEFRKRPFCTAVCCHVVPPMRFATESCDALEQLVLSGMPIMLVAAGQAGATSPAALAGSVAQACAEVLAGLVVCNLVDPDCRVIFAAWPFVSDLRTGSMTGGSGEQALLSAACAQMADFYNLPNSVPAGMTDAKIPDAQSGGEKGVAISLAAHAGASMIAESAGMLGSIMGTSLESYVIDNDLLGAVQRTVRGIEVDEDTLSFEVIRDVVNGDGHFLGHEQTLNRMKSDYLYPSLADRRSTDEWEQDGAMDSRARAKEVVREILGSHYPDHIDPAIDKVIRERFNIILPQQRMMPGNGVW